MKRPNRFYGSAKASGANAAAGTIVSLVIDNATVGTGTVDAAGNYVADAVERGTASYAGKPVTFFVGQKKATQTGTYTSREVTKVDLTAT